MRAISSLKLYEVTLAGVRVYGADLPDAVVRLRRLRELHDPMRRQPGTIAPIVVDTSREGLVVALNRAATKPPAPSGGTDD